MILRNSILFLLSGLFSNMIWAQSQVFLATPDQKGQGILKQGPEDCYVIAPFHLVEDYFGAIEVRGRGYDRARAKLIADLGSDIAILSLENDAATKCPTWEFDDAVKNLAASTLEGYLETADQDGAIDVAKVQVVRRDEQYLYVKPSDAGHTIIKGMSGSSLVISDGVQKIFLGLLLSVDNKGVGTVIQVSQLSKILNSFFTSEIVETVVVEVFDRVEKLNSELTSRAIEILSTKFPGKKFIAKEVSVLPKGSTRWVIKSSTEIDSENRIDANIHKYKTKLNLEVIKEKSRTHKLFLGGAIDYDRDAAMLNSFAATIGNIQ
jgi:hypothetical protein